MIQPKNKPIDLDNPAHPGHSDYLISTGGLKAERVYYSDNPLFESTENELITELDSHYSERCGFIDSEQDIYKVQNVHDNPHKNFYMDTDDAQRVINEIYKIKENTILGIYHTHPNGYPWPSPRDICGWPNPKLGWRYFLVTRGTITEWKLVSS